MAKEHFGNAISTADGVVKFLHDAKVSWVSPPICVMAVGGLVHHVWCEVARCEPEEKQGTEICHDCPSRLGQRKKTSQFEVKDARGFDALTGRMGCVESAEDSKSRFDRGQNISIFFLALKPNFMPRNIKPLTLDLLTQSDFTFGDSPTSIYPIPTPLALIPSCPPPAASRSPFLIPFRKQQRARRGGNVTHLPTKYSESR